MNLKHRKISKCPDNKAGTVNQQTGDISEIFFKVGGYFGGFQKVLIRKGEPETAVCAYHTEWGREPDFCAIKQFGDDDWEQLIRFLSDELHIGEWEREYVDENICDGTDWCLGLTFSDGSQRGFSGRNAFPPLFDRLEARFVEIYRETTENRISLYQQKIYMPLFTDVEGISDALENSNETMVQFADFPLPGISLAEMQGKIDRTRSGKDLADIYAAVSNKSWWTDLRWYDADEDPETGKQFRSARRDWWELGYKLRKRIAAAAEHDGLLSLTEEDTPDEEELQKAEQKLVDFFMRKYGYVEIHNFWIRIEDDSARTA